MAIRRKNGPPLPKSNPQGKAPHEVFRMRHPRGPWGVMRQQRLLPLGVFQFFFRSLLVSLCEFNTARFSRRGFFVTISFTTTKGTCSKCVLGLATSTPSNHLETWTALKLQSASDLRCRSSTNLPSEMQSVSSSHFLVLTSQDRASQVLFLNGPVVLHPILFFSFWARFHTL